MADTCKDIELVSKVRSHRYTIFDQIGVRPGRCLGCGANGCVFAVHNGVGVLKFMADDHERALAGALIGPRREPFLPVFYGAWSIPAAKLGIGQGGLRRESHGTTMFPSGIEVVHREELADFMPVNLAAYSDAMTRLLEDCDGVPYLDRALREYSRVSRETRRQPAERDIEAIRAVAGLLAWGKKLGINFYDNEFAWEDDDDAQDDEDEFLPNAITNLGVTKDGHVVCRDLGGFELPSSDSLAAMAARIKAAYSVHANPPPEPNSWLYSVTWSGRLPSIAEYGLVPDAPEAIGSGGYRHHSQGRVFLTHCDGVFFWYSRYQEHAEHNSDDVLGDGMIPVVLRVWEGAVEHEFHDDPHGMRDASHPAWFIEGPISPDDIEVWNGEEWIPVAEWDSIDVSIAVTSEQDPDEPERELHWWNNEEPLRPRRDDEDKRPNIGLPKPTDPFDAILAAIDGIVNGGAAFEWIFGTNDPVFMNVIREALVEWGPFPGLLTRDKGRSFAVGTQDPRVLRNFVVALRKLRDAGVSGSEELASAIMAKL